MLNKNLTVNQLNVCIKMYKLNWSICLSVWQPTIVDLLSLSWPSFLSLLVNRMLGKSGQSSIGLLGNRLVTAWSCLSLAWSCAKSGRRANRPPIMVPTGRHLEPFSSLHGTHFQPCCYIQAIYYFNMHPQL